MKESKIPTAKEFFEERHYQGYPQHELDHYSFRLDTLHKTMIEFAKLHVEAALKKALETIWDKSYVEYSGDGMSWNVDESILDVYPDELIK